MILLPIPWREITAARLIAGCSWCRAGSNAPSIVLSFFAIAPAMDTCRAGLALRTRARNRGIEGVPTEESASAIWLRVSGPALSRAPRRSGIAGVPSVQIAFAASARIAGSSPQRALIRPGQSFSCSNLLTPVRNLSKNAISLDPRRAAGRTAQTNPGRSI